MNEQAPQQVSFGFSVRSLLVFSVIVALMLGVAISLYRYVEKQYNWQVHALYSAASHFPEIDNLRITFGNDDLFYEVEQVQFSLVDKPESTIAVSIPHAARESTIRQILRSAIDDERRRVPIGTIDQGATALPQRSHGAK